MSSTFAAILAPVRDCQFYDRSRLETTESTRNAELIPILNSSFIVLYIYTEDSVIEVRGRADSEKSLSPSFHARRKHFLHQQRPAAAVRRRQLTAAVGPNRIRNS